MSRLLNLSSLPSLSTNQPRSNAAAASGSRVLTVSRVPLLAQLLEDESGQDLIEYALVAALIGLATVASMHSLSTRISSAFNSVGNSLTSAV